MFRGAAIALALLALAGCQKVEIRARCTVRPAGSYCVFQNTGNQPGRACFRVRVLARTGATAYAQTRACSSALRPGEESTPQPITFEPPNPFDRCIVDPATEQPVNCTVDVVTDRVEPM